MSEIEFLPVQGPRHRWTVGAYTFALYTTGPQRWRWECSAYGRGVGGHRTPVGACIALRRWLRAVDKKARETA